MICGLIIPSFDMKLRSGSESSRLSLMALLMQVPTSIPPGPVGSGR